MSAAKSSREGGRKKRKTAAKKEAPAEAEEDEEEDDEEGDAADGQQEVDFVYQEPDESDYHSIRDLIKCGPWDFAEPDFSQLADSIAGQGNIGNLIKSSTGEGDDDETLCGLLTALNLRQFPENTWPEALKKAVVARAKEHADPAIRSKLEAILAPGDSKEVAAVFSERFVNLPLDLIAPLYKELLEDIAWSCTTDECPPEEQPFYKLTHFLCAARCRKAQPGQATSAQSHGLVFLRPEDEVLAGKASFLFSFPMKRDASSSGEGVGKKRKAKGHQGSAPDDLRAIFGLTRKAFEQASRGLQAELVRLADQE